MQRNKLLLLLALLLTAATGAWAQDAKHLITATGDKTRSLEQPLPYATTIGALYEAVTGKSFSDLISTMSAVEKPLTGINSTKTDVVSIGELNGAGTPVTVKADGEATVIINFSGYNQAIFVNVVPPLYAYVKDGVKDDYEWTVKVGEGQAQALPIGGLKGDGSETVTLQYNGRLKVKGVKATSDAAAAEESDLLSGVFSVSSTKKVNFSKGNLQATYNGTDWTWAFAKNQWDYIGNAAGNTSVNGNGTVSASNVTVDLFGWVGASSTWTGAAQYGISNSTATDNTDGYGNVAREALKSDWGNTIGTGWFTLSSDEWQYLFKTRTTGGTVFGTEQARYAQATINTDGTSVTGMILFPDGVSIASTEVTTAGSVNATSAYATKCTTAQWAALAAKGCVFLPAAGNRNEASVYSAGSGGYYWSSSPNTSSSYYAYRVIFLSGNLSLTTQTNRYLGYSVRLVHATSGEAPAEAYTLLSAATTSDYGKVVCAAGHLHDAKTAVPTGCTAVGIVGKVTETGHGLILALQDATEQRWNTINDWTSVTSYAGTTLKVLPDDAARGGNLTSYTALGETAVSDWAVAQKSDYEAIFKNLGSTKGDSDGTTYDANVNAYITTGVGGTAISGDYWSATDYNGSSAWDARSSFWGYDSKSSSNKVRPVLGF